MIKKILLTIAIFLFIFGCYLFIGKTEPAEKITWGVNFSQKQAQNLGLGWKETYLALLDDLGVKNIKLATYWDLIEQKEEEYQFDDLDWQIKEAENRGAKILLVIGMKSPRWPECHIPEWAKNFKKEEQQKEILSLIEKIVLKYRDSEAIKYWQVENEPFFPFGECPWTDKNFLKKEIELVKKLDTKPVIISDSGELPFWITAARMGDVVGITMYKKVWFAIPGFLKTKSEWLKRLEIGTYIYYPFPPTFYNRKAQIIRKIFGKEVIGVELQAEPWGQEPIYNSPLEEQKKTMNLEQFKYNIDFAKKTGLGTHYLWGAEWWFWMKTKQNNSEIWDEAGKLF